MLEPQQTIEFGGLTTNTTSMVLSLPAEKIKKIRAEARRMAKQTGISARQLSRLLGKMKDAANVIPVAPLFYRNLQMSLSGALNANYQSYKAQVDLSLESREELEWWDNHMRNWNGKTLLRSEIDLVIDSDAYLPGPEDWRSLVSRGREHAHQLSGAACSNFGSPDFHERPDKSLSAVEDR